MSKKLKAVKFSQVKVGQRFRYNEGATAWDVKIVPVKAHVKSGFVNCIEQGGTIRMFVEDEKIVWVEQ